MFLLLTDKWSVNVVLTICVSAAIQMEHIVVFP
jgi:hypothetical protein